ncbi:MAG: DUF305 domain-containing protein [Actinomycetota bacterium]|nr:DUF305 domain-containing protein [Actinomycetota bacterium]
MTTPSGPRAPRWLIPVAVLMAVLLVAAGGALAVITGIGRTEPPAEASIDVGFARDMSAHHAQAVTMAGIARDQSNDVDVRTLAFDIETGQNQQIGVMLGWLQVWDRPVNGTAEPMAWMAGHQMSMLDGNLMPGMATSDELNRLRAASGDELDVLFLQLMIRHHHGGVQMARYAVEPASTSPVRTLARSMANGQAAEIATMQGMLADRGGSTLPYP